MRLWAGKSILPVCLFLLAAGGAAAQSASELPGKLGLTPAEAKTSIVEALGSRSVFSEPAFKAFKAMAPEGRATIVRAGLSWIKGYVETAEFKAEYAKYRENHKPEPPAAKLSADEEIKKQRAEMDKQIAEMRKNAADLDAQTRKTIEEAVKAMQAQMEAMEKDPEQKKLLQEMYAMQAVQEKEAYAERLKAWEEEYPAEARPLIARRIREFLGESADVDFGAKLVKSGILMRFADSAYEEKPATWKLCFRAGKDAVEAARSFASAWLAEIEK